MSAPRAVYPNSHKWPKVSSVYSEDKHFRRSEGILHQRLRNYSSVSFTYSKRIHGNFQTHIRFPYFSDKEGVFLHRKNKFSFKGFLN